MPPKVKFSKEQIVRAGLNVIKKKGVEAMTAREVAAKLGVSTRPIFTYFDTMDELKAEVYVMAVDRYKVYIEKGLLEEIPFLGAGLHHLKFAKQEPELYKLLFLTNREEKFGGVTAASDLLFSLVKYTIMAFYGMDEETTNRYYRNMFVVVFGIGTMLAMGECPYEDAEIRLILRQMSLSFVKTVKEIPEFLKDDYDRDRYFGKFIKSMAEGQKAAEVAVKKGQEERKKTKKEPSRTEAEVKKKLSKENK